MYGIRNIGDDLFYVGASDRRLALFENVYPVPDGVSYNAYVLRDEKNVLFDTVDKAVETQFVENVEKALNGGKLDYIVVNHMEPDHCATLETVVSRHPEAKIVGNAKTFGMIRQFFGFDADSRAVVVKEGDELNTGKHTLTFFMAPMVHWPEVMATFDKTDGTLFSADAFGTFGALDGNIFADEGDFFRDRLGEARRYYANIVGKYGVSVQALLKKIASLDVKTVCPLHGPVWREDFGRFAGKYEKWAAYEPEEKAVMIACGSIYGHTENAANVLAAKLADRGVRDIAFYDVSSTHPSVVVAEAFRCSTLVFASATYNAEIFTPMENVLTDLKAHALQNRSVFLIENGTWAPAAGRKMRELFATMKNMTVSDVSLTIKSALRPEQEKDVDAMADAIKATL